MKEWNESQIFVHTYIFLESREFVQAIFCGSLNPFFIAVRIYPDKVHRVRPVWAQWSKFAPKRRRSPRRNFRRRPQRERLVGGWESLVLGGFCFKTFPLVFFGCPVRNYYELWKLDVTEGMVWDRCKKWVGAFWKRSPWFLIWRWSGFWEQVCNITSCNTSLYRRLLPMERTRLLSRSCFNSSPAAILCFSPRPHKAKPLDCMSHLASFFFQENNLWSGHNLYPFQPCLVSLRPPASQFSRHSSSQEMRVMGFLEGRKHPRFACILLIYIYISYVYIYIHPY